MLFRISYLYSYIKNRYIYTVQYHPICFLRNPICFLRNPICFTTTKILNYSTQTKKKASKFRRFCENVYVKVSLYNYCFSQILYVLLSANNLFKQQTSIFNRPKKYINR